MIKVMKKKDCDCFNELKLRMRDVETYEEYDVSITTVWFAFPGLKHSGARLEAFIKRPRAKYGEFQELHSVILKNGKLEMINW